MNPILLTAGVVAVMAAVIGGGLKAFDIEVPVLESRRVRTALGGLGVVFLVAAFLIRDGEDPSPDPERSRYERQVTAACNYLRAVAKRNTIGLPREDLTFDKSAMLARGRDNVAAMRRRLNLLLEKEVPDGLEDEAQLLRTRSARFLSEQSALLKQLGKTLPANPTFEQINAAVQPLEDRSDRVTARLEDALSQLAGGECTLVES